MSYFGNGDGSARYARQLADGKVVKRNYSAHPKGQERTTAPVFSIWPEGKVAKPGRMA